MLIWIDKSILKIKKKSYKAGDIIPGDVLTKERIEFFIATGRIKNDDKKVVIQNTDDDKELRKEIKLLKAENEKLLKANKEFADKVKELESNENIDVNEELELLELENKELKTKIEELSKTEKEQ